MVLVDLLKTGVRTPDLQGDQRMGENADERAPFKGKRPGHISTAIINRLGVQGGALQGGTSIRPKRTLTWELGVDVKLETGGFGRGAIVLGNLPRGQDDGGRATRNSKNPSAKLHCRSKYLQRTGF